MSKKAVNRQELAKYVAQVTGFTQKDVLEVLSAEDDVIAELISQGYPIKKHKLYKIDIETKPEKRAWDGLNEKYFTIPEKKIIKMKPLSGLNRAVDELNEGIENTGEE